MDRSEVRRQVLEAIQQGKLPPGGPSELAAYDLLDDVPVGYWERCSEGSLDRIRAQIQAMPPAAGGLVGEEVPGD